MAGGRAMVMLAVMAPRVPATAANGSERRRRDMGEIELPRRAGKWLSRAARGTVDDPTAPRTTSYPTRSIVDLDDKPPFPGRADWSSV